MIENQEFNEMLNNPVRELVGRVELYIRDADSTLSDVCGCHDYLKSFTIDRVGENKFFGYGICQRMNVKILDYNRSIDVSTANYLEAVFGVGSEYDYHFPAFYVTEVNRDETNNQLSVTAYDKIYKATEHTVSEIELESYTVREFTEACANILGLPLNIQSDNPMFDVEYPEGANFDGTENIREAMNDVAELTGCVYFINKDWELTFKELDRDGDPVMTIGKDTYFSLDSKTNRRLSDICSTTELGDNVTASTGVSGTTMYLRENAFLNMRDDVGELLQNALDRVGNMTINQFECKWRGNWLIEIGDKIGFVTKDNQVTTSYFLNDVISYDGTLSEETKWEFDDNSEETESNPSTLGEALKQTFAKVDKANKQIDLVASEVDGNSKSISSIQINAGEIIQSVSDINSDIEELTKRVESTMTAEDVRLEIKSELGNGVDKVETSTGFTFNDEGLTVSKSDSELSTTITEDGMRICREEEEVLKVDNTGVDAANLHATTYLIIGLNSRFEDYDNGTRTGCFWIGESEVE